jgi:hypothetical protein
MTDKQKFINALKIAKDSNTIKMKGNLSVKDTIIYHYLNLAYDELTEEIKNDKLIIETPEQLKQLITIKFDELCEKDQLKANQN